MSRSALLRAAIIAAALVAAVFVTFQGAVGPETTIAQNSTPTPTPTPAISPPAGKSVFVTNLGQRGGVVEVRTGASAANGFTTPAGSSYELSSVVVGIQQGTL